MGIALSSKRVDYEISVKTGDVKSAGTDSNVYVALVDEIGAKSRRLLLDCRWRNDFEKGSLDVFQIRNVPNLSNIERIEIWRDNKGIGDDWFVEYVQVKKMRSLKDGLRVASEVNLTNDYKEKRDLTDIAPFPCNRWIKSNRRYQLIKYDSLLPQLDDRAEQRRIELEEKRASYELDEKVPGFPKQVRSCPKEESFSNDYKWDIVGRKFKLLAQVRLLKITTDDNWDDLEDLLEIYKGYFEIPQGYYNWKSDKSFGIQRLGGCNPTVFRRCNEIPPNFAVTSEMVEPFLDNFKLEEAMLLNQIYIVDHSVLHGLECKEGRTVCAPLALFHAKRDGEFLPIAIQLFQEAADDNPVFLPSDPPFTWMLAKMYFNNADCSIHQACTHLGFTHLIVETISIAAHRELSPSHPVFQLLAPHFLYLIAINSLAVAKLLAPGGWIDITMTMGACGLFEIVRRKWKHYRLDREGWLPADLKARGVDSKEDLPFYPYRDDGLLLHEAIQEYVTDVLEDIYDTPEKLLDDYEVQAWAKCLSDDVDGAAINGVFGGGKFEVLQDLIKTVTSIIFLSSVGHASANFAQYDEYAFPPNYPAMLSGKAPTNKDEVTELDIVKQLPNRETTLSIMVVTKILSDRGTNGLGDFEVQYQYRPKAVAAVEKFCSRLKEISQEIKDRNKVRPVAYPYLDPEEVPNAISI